MARSADSYRTNNISKNYRRGYYNRYENSAPAYAEAMHKEATIFKWEDSATTQALLSEPGSNDDHIIFLDELPEVDASTRVAIIDDISDRGPCGIFEDYQGPDNPGYVDEDAAKKEAARIRKNAAAKARRAVAKAEQASA